MLVINTPSIELYDPTTESFINYDPVRLELEHSLIAISKWESKWMKPFLGVEEKTTEQIYDYVMYMITNTEVTPHFIQSLPMTTLDTITNYIQSPMTATTINSKSSKQSREVITSELIYYWMIAFNIPFECQQWHLNRLLMLVNICNIKNSPPKKVSQKETLSRNRSLNEARKKALCTSG